MNKKIFSTIIMLCVCVAITAEAQKAATVKSFTQTTDHIPVNDRRNDLNNNPCALVKVQVVDDIERIEGNKIGDIVNRGVEKWVYMCKGSRNMRIHLKNHLPVKVMFQDYHINGLESNRVYELVIEIPDASASVPLAGIDIIAKQKLVINYAPTHAMVLVDSKPYRGNGRIELQLPVGEHSYLIAADGYITAEASVKLTERAPREISENLVSDNTAAANRQQMDKQAKTKRRKNQDTYINSGKDNQNYNLEPLQPQTIKKAKKQKTKKQKSNSLNKSFKYVYEGVTFKCKAKGEDITITGFDVKVDNVIIPARVEYEGRLYPVREIDTFINGNNYSATRLVVEEGVEVIAKYAFAEFRNLIDVTLPSSIIEIGRNAFRDNAGMRLNLPPKINESDLRDGREIKVIL